MDFQLTQEQRMLRQTVREFAEAEIAPLVEEYEAEAKFPRPVILRLWRELGLGGMSCSEEYGGLGLDPVSFVVVVEELARVWAALSIAVSVHNSVGVQLIDIHGNEAQRREYLPKLTSDWIAAFSLSEPGAGSDVSAIRAVAVREGDHYALSGEKNWVTNGQTADLYIVFVKTDPAAGSRGITAFIVERALPGLTVSRPERKMGIKSSEAVVLSFDRCRVPARNRLGEEGQGFKIAMLELDAGRIGVGAQAVGIAQAALERALRYAREREAFGKPIAEFQAVQWMLADMATELYAMKNMVYETAWRLDQGSRSRARAAMVKLFCTEAIGRIADRAVQIHGGMGYMKEAPIEGIYREVRAMRIYEGTSEIQRLIISRDVLKNAMKSLGID